MKKIALVLMAVSFIAFNLSAQKKIKFGNIDFEDLKMEVYEKDTNAHAVILSDIGTQYFDESFNNVFERHLRIKILDKKGFDEANINFTINPQHERLQRIKGFTFTLEDGKVIKTKLNKEGIFKEKTVDKYVQRIKTTFPNVKEGSIVDIIYTVSTQAFFIRDWSFQTYIPTVRSEYTVHIPEYFTVTRNVKGYFPLTKQNVKRESSGYAQNSFQANIYYHLCENVPAFKKEAYMTTADNFLTAVEFEMESVNIPGNGNYSGYYKKYTSTWDIVNRELNDDEDFGARMRMVSFYKDDLKKVLSEVNSEDPFVKMNAIMDFVKSKMKWNEYNSIYAFKSLRTSYNEGEGNSAEINMILTLMLNEAGFETYPVVLSTRNNGIILPTHPTIKAFNYLIAAVKIDDDYHLMDATEPLSEINLLPKRCLNGQGRLIGEKFSTWIDVETNNKDKSIMNYILTLNSEGDLEGRLQCKRESYSALYFRKNLKTNQNEDEFIKSFEEENTGLSINEYEFSNLDDLSEPIVEKYTITVSDQIDLAGDLIMFNPLFYDKIDENPFKLEKRTYPVDYAYPIDEVVIVNMQIPEGYEIDKIPESVAFGITGKNAIYVYRVSVNGNFIQVRSQFQINKSMFVSTEYEELKEFYNQVIIKQSEQIILKKSTQLTSEL